MRDAMLIGTLFLIGQKQRLACGRQISSKITSIYIGMCILKLVVPAIAIVHFFGDGGLSVEIFDELLHLGSESEILW